MYILYRLVLYVHTNTNTRCCYHSILEVPDTSPALFIVMSNERAHVYDNADNAIKQPNVEPILLAILLLNSR